MDPKKIDNLLTLLFYILVAATIVTYFVWPQSAWKLYLGFSALGIRLFTYILRYLL